MEVGVEVWLKDVTGNQAWIPAMIQSKEKKNEKFVIKVRSEEHDREKVFSLTNENEELEEVKLRNDPSETRVENLINLPYLHEPAILHCLEERYNSSDIYTYTGPILIAVNPFKTVQLYTSQILESYYNQGLMKSQGLNSNSVAPLPPHVYAIADAAYRDMMSVILQGYSGKKGEKSGNQAILISGESGAGKTESTKIVLKYLTTLGSALEGSDGTGLVMDKILQSNPILEAFGNARTIRNDNSSRFGKFIELNFNKRGHLIGGIIRTYLLEKVRLPSQQLGERNFHIFYQILAGASNEEREKWNLLNAEDYWFTSQGDIFKLKHMNDAEEYLHMKKALNTLNFNEQDQVSVLNVMAGLLHLGQVRFRSDKDGDGSEVEIDDEDVKLSLEMLSKLLGLTIQSLTKVLTIRIIVTREETLEVKLTPQQATDARDAFAKAIYGQTFDWIVRTINKSILVDSSQIRAEIGVLDIFGFECFKHNSFEQLCINYTNETLQQQFNQFVFKMEQIEYQKEHIEWSFVEFPDNQDCLDLIEHKQKGILAMLDDECKLPGASDEKFASRLYKSYEGNNHRFTTTATYKRDCKFCIVHYAGPVVYSTITFVEKNKDELPKEADNLLRNSQVQLLVDVFNFKANLLGNFGSSNNSGGKPGGKAQTQNNSKATAGGGGGGGGGGGAKNLFSVSSQFKEQLSSLMEKIYSISPHYIRCLKPNDENIPDSFDRLRTTEQLRYGGVLEAVRVARSGFPIRLSHLEFYSRYRPLANPFYENLKKMPTHLVGKAYEANEKVKKYCDMLLESLYDNTAVSVDENSSSNSNTKSSKQGRNRSQSVIADIVVWRGPSEIPQSSIQLGLTKVFLRKAAHDILEGCRSRRIFAAAKRIQCHVRKQICRMKYLRFLWAIKLIQRITRGGLARMKAQKLRREKAILTLQKRIRGFLILSKFKIYRRALIKLQCRYRSNKAKLLLTGLRKAKAAINLQRFLRGITKRFKYRRYLRALIWLQCGFRKKCAKRELIKLRMAAKDLGLLQQNNNALKAEIELLRAKAAENTRIIEEKAAAAKEAENEKMLTNFAELKALYEKEVKLRQIAEEKLGQTEEKLNKSEDKLNKSEVEVSSLGIKLKEVEETNNVLLKKIESLEFTATLYNSSSFQSKEHINDNGRSNGRSESPTKTPRSPSKSIHSTIQREEKERSISKDRVNSTDKTSKVVEHIIKTTDLPVATLVEEENQTRSLSSDVVRSTSPVKETSNLKSKVYSTPRKIGPNRTPIRSNSTYKSQPNVSNVPVENQKEFEDLKELLLKEKSEKELLEEEVSRLRHISIDLRAQLETLKTQQSQTASTTNNSLRRPDVEPKRKIGKPKIETSSNNEVSSPTSNNSDNNINKNENGVLSPKSPPQRRKSIDPKVPLAQSSIEQFEKNIQTIKTRLSLGFRVLAFESARGQKFEVNLKLDQNNDIIHFESTTRRFLIFSGSKPDIAPIKLEEITDTCVGVDGGEENQSNVLTIVSKFQNRTRTTFVEFNNISDRNNILTGLRSIVSEFRMSATNNLMKNEIQKIDNENNSSSLSTSVSASVAGQNPLHTSEEISQIKKQLLLERNNCEQMMAQVVLVTNDLNERDREISDLRSKEKALASTLHILEKNHEQDAMVRMQLGKRLEQVLIEKEEALEQLDNMKERFR